MTVIRDRVRIDTDNGVADVQLIRADKMNALDFAMFEALVEAADVLERQSGLRAVVLSGAGRAFCAGIDLEVLPSLQSPEQRAKLMVRSYRGTNLFQRAVVAWHDLPVPVIAAVHGIAFGGGFQLMLGADMRFIEPQTKLSVMEIRWGLVPDMAGTVLMRALARDDVIRELTYTGRTFSGADALAMGFATRNCADPRGDALALAHDIAGKSPDGIRATKTLLRGAAFCTVADQLIAESQMQDALLAGSNHAEAVAAGLGKRAPVFKD